jgi:hypothetical protein
MVKTGRRCRREAFTTNQAGDRQDQNLFFAEATGIRGDSRQRACNARHCGPPHEQRHTVQPIVIIGQAIGYRGRIPVRPEFHSQAPSLGAQTAMPWALQQHGDKNVSIFRRRSCVTVTTVSAVPSSREQSMRAEGVFSDEKIPSAIYLSTEIWVHSAIDQAQVRASPKTSTGKKETQKGARSLTAPIWNVSSPCPHRGKTGGSSEEDVSAPPKEPETHARFPKAHEHPSGARSHQPPSPQRAQEAHRQRSQEIG